MIVLLEKVLSDIQLLRRFKHLAALDHHLAALRGAEPEGAIEDDAIDVAAAVLATHGFSPVKEHPARRALG
jgi:hypothetical protein